MKYDYLIVGAGFSGSVLAERLKSSGKKVVVVDRRNHVGGNCYDYYDSAGVLVHAYGPHYFRTDNKDVLDYLSKFTQWRKYRYRIRSCVCGELYPVPINRDTLNKFFSINLVTEDEAKKFLESKREKIEHPANAEEQVLSTAGRELYEAFFKNYTLKQWGINPKKLVASVTARIPIRFSTDDSYLEEKFQAMPLKGYAEMFKNMLKGVDVLLNTDFRAAKEKIDFDKLIYTGPIDEYFNHKYGRLQYRSLRFEFETFDREYYQEWSQINYPNDFDYTRIVEIKHATGQKTPKTTIVKEYPCAEGEPFYPMPLEAEKELYLKYKKEASGLSNVYFVGRLAQYEYLNMDQVCKRALDLFKALEV
jgi:UDP-galactopyranose mutase